ncbi:MAG: TrkA C-terminal domain-containing protein [SAR324 cluster bacterium]|nr:TrkA C-terminal domain-containing protein [SAR324 cluster bacterium]
MTLSGLPVVQKEGSKAVIGVVWHKDILHAYHKEIERRELTSTFADKIQLQNNFKSEVRFMEGFSISEILIPKSMLGQSIIALDFRNNFSAVILTVRKNNKNGMQVLPFPEADYVFEAGDSVILAGEAEKLARFKAIV